MYDRFIRDGFGKKKIGEVKYSDELQFYYDLLHNKGLQINTLDNIHTVLHPTFQLAVRDGIIRNNPTDGVMAEINKKTGNKKGIRHALTLEQQRAFMDYIAQSPVFVGAPVFHCIARYRMKKRRGSWTLLGGCGFRKAHHQYQSSDDLLSETRGYLQV